MRDLNKLFYEYENLSLEAYNPKKNRYQGSNPKNQIREPKLQKDLLLFENSENEEVKTEFNYVMADQGNPFSKVRLWLMYEVLEVDALQEAFAKRRQVLKTYRSTVQQV